MAAVMSRLGVGNLDELVRIRICRGGNEIEKKVKFVP